MKNVLIFWKLFKLAFDGFLEDNCLRLSASLSYYTIFSIAPILIIVISLVGVFYGTDAVQGRIYGQINGWVGNVAADQIQEIIKNVEHSKRSGGGVFVGFIILLIGATGVFTEIQDSINYIWSIKAKPKKGWIKLLLNRLLSFSLIAGFGFILLVSLVVNTIMDVFSDRLRLLFPDGAIYLFYAFNVLFIFFVISTLFAIIFKVLPDAHIHWRDSFIGALFTAFLFIAGKFLIGFYIGNTNIGETYGTTVSLILILLWVYYSSIILFFGAEFTKMYALHYGGKITPNGTAVFIIKQEVKEISIETAKAKSIA